MGWRTLRARRWLTKVLIYLLAVSVIVFAFKNMESLQYVHRRLQPSVTPVFQAMTEPYEILQQEQQLAGHPLSTMLLNRSKEEQSVLRLDRRLWRPEDLAYQSLPNLPTYYLLHKEPKITEDSCAEYPSLYDLHFNNLNWQVMQSTNGTFYLYNAYLDDRTTLIADRRPSIRILAMIDRIKPSLTTYCHIWYDNKHLPVVTEVKEYRYIWFKSWGNYRQGILQPYLLQCVIPPKYRDLVPSSVSLVEQRCSKATNNLKVIHNMPHEGRKEDFAVCVKGLDFTNDLSVRLVEWLELLFLLGAHKVFLYNLGIHPNASKVLSYYESLGRVHVTKLTLPGQQPNALGLQHMYLNAKIIHKRQNELIPYNDCLYQNMNRYNYIAVLDTDEVIMPIKTPDWVSLISQITMEESSKRSSYCARHVYFLDSMQEAHSFANDVPSYMHMLRNLYRAANYTKPGHYVKCFHNPQLVLTLHNHFPFSCLSPGCSSKELPLLEAHLQHYRSDCVGELKKVCPYFKTHTILDDSIYKVKEPLIHNTLHTLQYLGFLPSDQS